MMGWRPFLHSKDKEYWGCQVYIEGSLSFMGIGVVLHYRRGGGIPDLGCDHRSWNGECIWFRFSEKEG